MNSLKQLPLFNYDPPVILITMLEFKKALVKAQKDYWREMEMKERKNEL